MKRMVARQWDDERLDKLSTITPDDIESAGEWWQRNAPTPYKKLLDAQPDDTTESR